MANMEQGEQNLEMEKLIVFKDEMRKFSEDEAVSGKTSHLAGFNSEDLNIEDMYMWQTLKNFKDGDDVKVLKNYFNNYRLSLESVNPMNASRGQFSGLVANKIYIISLEDELNR